MKEKCLAFPNILCPVFMSPPPLGFKPIALNLDTGTFSEFQKIQYPFKLNSSLYKC